MRYEVHVVTHQEWHNIVVGQEYMGGRIINGLVHGGERGEVFLMVTAHEGDVYPSIGDIIKECEIPAGWAIGIARMGQPTAYAIHWNMTPRYLVLEDFPVYFPLWKEL